MAVGALSLKQIVVTGGGHGVWGEPQSNDNFERTLAYRRLFSPETLARLEAHERGEPMPPYPDGWHGRSEAQLRGDKRLRDTKGASRTGRRITCECGTCRKCYEREWKRKRAAARRQEAGNGVI